jgi:hypothetical protein
MEEEILQIIEKVESYNFKGSNEFNLILSQEISDYIKNNYIKIKK